MTQQRFANRSFIVTGGASGIGAAISARLLDEGASVVIADINFTAAQEEAAKYGDVRGQCAVPLQLDVTSRINWEKAITKAIDTFGSIHGLVNNAGITRDKSMLKMTDGEYDAVLDTHLRGTWLGCQTAIPRLRETKGSIVNISSSGRNGAFGQTNYSAAKAGIVGLTKAVALEQASYGIRCNAVAPGAIMTPMTSQVPKEVKEAWLGTIALSRLGQPREIAAAVAFLLSDDASYVNAHVLDVNGGEQHL